MNTDKNTNKNTNTNINKNTNKHCTKTVRKCFRFCVRGGGVGFDRQRSRQNRLEPGGECKRPCSTGKWSIFLKFWNAISSFWERFLINIYIYI